MMKKSWRKRALSLACAAGIVAAFHGGQAQSMGQEGHALSMDRQKPELTMLHDPNALIKPPKSQKQAQPKAQEKLLTGKIEKTVPTVTAVTKVFGTGEEIIALALEYPAEIDPKSIAIEDFKVTGKQIYAVYTNDRPQDTWGNSPGRYIILRMVNSGVHLNLPPMADKKEVQIEIHQVGAITAKNGVIFDANERAAKISKAFNTSTFGFKAGILRDEKTGAELPYYFFVPQDYDAEQSYPLLIFLNDSERHPLLYGNGGTIWASAQEQAKHPAIIVVPHYTKALEKKQGKDTQAGRNMLFGLAKGVVASYNIDPERIYGVGQGAGAEALLALSAEHPKFFAAHYLAGAEISAHLAAGIAEQKLWLMEPKDILVDGALKVWKGLGTKVSRNIEPWKASAEDLVLYQATTDLAHSAGQVKYSALDVDGAQSVWEKAYDMEEVRDWLFEQKKGETEEHRLMAASALRQGLLSYSGEGELKDFQRAMRFFKTADEAGNRNAARYIGYLYEYGMGTPTNYKMARKYYDKAAKQGDIVGMYYLGRLYERGFGTDENPQLALRYYEKSAARNSIYSEPAMRAAARMYEEGIGVEKNAEKAAEYRAMAERLSPGES